MQACNGLRVEGDEMKGEQTERVVAALKSQWLTYDEMRQAAKTMNGYRRALEWEDRNSDKWRIDRKKNARGLVVWRIVRNVGVTGLGRNRSNDER